MTTRAPHPRGRAPTPAAEVMERILKQRDRLLGIARGSSGLVCHRRRVLLLVLGGMRSRPAAARARRATPARRAPGAHRGRRRPSMWPVVAVVAGLGAVILLRSAPSGAFDRPDRRRRRRPACRCRPSTRSGCSSPASIAAAAVRAHHQPRPHARARRRVRRDADRRGRRLRRPTTLLGLAAPLRRSPAGAASSPPARCCPPACSAPPAASPPSAARTAASGRRARRRRSAARAPASCTTPCSPP